jgi:hypothetical protein
MDSKSIFPPLVQAIAAPDVSEQQKEHQNSEGNHQQVAHLKPPSPEQFFLLFSWQNLARAASLPCQTKQRTAEGTAAHFFAPQ